MCSVGPLTTRSPRLGDRIGGPSRCGSATKESGANSVAGPRPQLGQRNSELDAIARAADAQLCISQHSWLRPASVVESSYSKSCDDDVLLKLASLTSYDHRRSAPRVLRAKLLQLAHHFLLPASHLAPILEPPSTLRSVNSILRSELILELPLQAQHANDTTRSIHRFKQNT